MLKDTLDKNEKIKPNSKELEILRANFPQCFDMEGNFDLKLFEELVKTKDINIKKEGYSLNFLGKSYARYLSNLDSETVIVPDESNKDSTSENIYIVGDNLDALQHLKHSYSGAIKCIYIDPPYNTGSDGFVYNDKFEFTAKELSDKIGIEEDEAERILNMQGKSTHSAWLTFMYPRLELARELLADDGAVFISLDDNETANCKLLCDFIFGEGNFVGQLTLQSNPRGSQNSNNLSYVHEYVLVYARNISSLKLEGVEKSQESLAEFNLEDSIGKYRLLGLRKRGGAWKKEDRPLMYYPIFVNPVDGSCSLEKTDTYNVEVIPKRPTGELGRWTWGKPKFLANRNLLVGKQINRRGETEAWDIFRKDYIANESGEIKNTKIKTIWTEKQINYQNAKNEIKELFDNSELFDYPKPTYLMSKLIEAIAYEDGDIILDFFAGSSSTAQAVMQSSIVDLTLRQFILVQLSEKIKENHVAYLSGFKTIDEIGRERIRRAAAKIKKDEPEKSKGVDLGFKTYYLKSPEVQTLDKIKEFNPTLPLDSGDIIKAFGKDTILETWKIKDGYGFNTPITEIELNGYIAYLINDGKHSSNLYLLDEISENQIMELVRKLENAELVIDKIIEYGYALSYTANTSLRTNLKTLKNRNSIDVIIRY